MRVLWFRSRKLGSVSSGRAGTFPQGCDEAEQGIEPAGFRAGRATDAELRERTAGTAALIMNGHAARFRFGNGIARRLCDAFGAFPAPVRPPREAQLLRIANAHTDADYYLLQPIAEWIVSLDRS